MDQAPLRPGDFDLLAKTGSQYTARDPSMQFRDGGTLGGTAVERDADKIQVSVRYFFGFQRVPASDGLVTLPSASFCVFPWRYMRPMLLGAICDGQCVHTNLHR